MVANMPCPPVEICAKCGDHYFLDDCLPKVLQPFCEECLSELKVIDVQYSKKYGSLGFRFNTGAWICYGPGVLPGTDVPTYRFVLSRGFKDKAEYKLAQALAQAYSKSLGFSGCQAHWESFQEPPSD